MDNSTTPMIFFETHTLSEVVDHARDFFISFNDGLEQKDSLNFQEGVLTSLISSFVAYHLFKQYPQVLEVIIRQEETLVMILVNKEEGYFFDPHDLAKLESVLDGLDGMTSFIKNTQKELNSLGILPNLYAEVTKNELNLFMTDGDPSAYNRLKRYFLNHPSPNPLSDFFSSIEKNMIFSELDQKTNQHRDRRKL